MEADHEAVANQALEECKAHVLPMLTGAGWKNDTNKDGVEICVRDGPTGMPIVKVVCTIRASAETILNYLTEPQNRPLWMDKIKTCEILHSFPSEARIVREIVDAPFPVSKREFIYAAKVYHEPNGVLVVHKSVEIGRPEGEAVRGEVLGRVVLLETLGGETRLTNVASVDPKGNIPGFIKKKSAKGVGKAILSLKRLIEKNH